MELSNTAINKIGNIIRNGDNTPEYNKAIETLNIWRESHGEILDKYFDQCVKLCQKIDKNIIVAQRLKRLPTIIGKLNRFKTMRLSSMQDIAGIRIITKDMGELKQVEKHLNKWSNLIRIDDYIKQPKNSGYRSKHFIFKKDNMLIEVQLRTLAQHLWATSVETTDLFRNSHLKEKSDKSYWHTFFCQVSSIFAIAENTKPISGYENLSINELCNQLRNNISKNSINSQIAGFTMLRPLVDFERSRDAYYIVIELDIKKREANVFEYPEKMYDIAFKKYQELEQAENTHKQIVLIGLNQIKKIQSAYPNYFIDLKTFVTIIEFLLEENGKIHYTNSNE